MSAARRPAAGPQPSSLDVTNVPDALLRALPKTDLYQHLDGSLRLETILDLGREQGIRLPAGDPESLGRLVRMGAGERSLERYLRAVARQERARVLASGAVQTHVHVLLEASTTTALSSLVQRLKGGSSALINREGHTSGTTPVRWARGYAIHTVGERGLLAARAYVEGQATHHPGERIVVSDQDGAVPPRPPWRQNEPRACFSKRWSLAI